MEKKKSIWYYLYRDKWLYLMLVPVILYYFIFKYLPMGGIAMAFQDFNMFKGIFGSKFAGLSVFKKICPASVLEFSEKYTDFKPADAGCQLSVHDYSVFNPE